MQKINTIHQINYIPPELVPGVVVVVDVVVDEVIEDTVRVKRKRYFPI